MTDTMGRVSNKHSVVPDLAVSPESHNAFRNQAMAAILQVGILYAAVAVPAQFVRNEVTPDTFLLFLSFWGALCFFILWRKIDWSGYRFVSFGALFLITSAFFRFVSFADILIYGNRIDEWTIYAEDPLLLIAYGQLILVVGTLLLVGTWLAFRGHENTIKIINGWRYDLGTLGFGYVIGVVTVLSIRVFNWDLAFLGSIIHVFFFIGSISILLISFGSAQKPNWERCILLPSLLSLPLLYAALLTGFKETIIFALLPTAAGIFVVFKGRLTRTLVCLTMAATYVFMTVFVDVQRVANWVEGRNLSTAQIFDLTVDGFVSDDELLTNAVRQAIQRKDFLELNGWSFAIVERFGHQESFSPTRTYEIFVPRILWAEKPQYRPGVDFTALIFGREMAETSSTAAGFFSALYLGAGVRDVVIFAMALGALFALSLSLVSRFGTPFTQSLLLSALTYRALRLDEGWPVYEFGGAISVLLVAIVVGNIISTAQKRAR